jgi:hypothetical protein
VRGWQLQLAFLCDVTLPYRYSAICGSYILPKTVSVQDRPKGKATQPQEWKAVVGKLPAGSVPKAAKPAPAGITSKNVKGGSTSTAAARKPLTSKN